MNHPLLGELVTDETLPQSFAGQIQFDGRAVSISIIPEDVTLEEVVPVAVKVVESLSELNDCAKDVVVNDLLEVYNSGWNEYDEVQEDGTLKEVFNPELTADEFRKQLTLTGIVIYDDTSVQFWYEDGGLFWGHGIYVSTPGGGSDFANARADLFG